MNNCSVCGHPSGRLELCFACAEVAWPRRIVNAGAKNRATMLLLVRTAAR